MCNGPALIDTLLPGYGIPSWSSFELSRGNYTLADLEIGADRVWTTLETKLRPTWKLEPTEFQRLWKLNSGRFGGRSRQSFNDFNFKSHRSSVCSSRRPFSLQFQRHWVHSFDELFQSLSPNAIPILMSYFKSLSPSTITILVSRSERSAVQLQFSLGSFQTHVDRHVIVHVSPSHELDSRDSIVPFYFLYM